ncbi:MAG: PhzF family phenazine biosynthesis protein, partial [Bacteroidota bacterium]
PSLYRYAAFTTSPDGGNPAGVWIGDTLPTAEVMQQIAQDVGYSETAFVAPTTGFDRTVRYFSPEVEVPFCGHATIATGIALGVTNGAGTYRLATRAGVVPVVVEEQGRLWEASLTSVEPKHETVSDEIVREALAALGWEPDCLDAAIPPARAYAGAWHLVLAVADARRLANLAYDFEALKAFMLREGFVTLQLVWRESDAVFHARNPFPVGGVVEDPATGAAAAALGGYLRDAGLLTPPATFIVRQGEAMGRPSRLSVRVPVEGGIVVTGTAVSLDEPSH